MSKKAIWLSDIEFIEMHSSDWERLESEAFEADESVQAQLNPNQQIVLDWLKTPPLFPISAIHLLEAGKNVPENVKKAYENFGKKEEAEVLQAFSQWALEQEEAE
ncbi:hypothetical protein KI112_002555 [Enterococcus faecalis]|uniref:hypothetical protein n=1 Tax=Enterococcus faecalis TaxID=1351 RepID=UPI001ECBD8EA|nr:hypothetical protein [Enterococcus faecalis]EHQ8842954.1 hypothetical protein [Enterococcus faecalis]EKD5213700.1 hypothetical protein [Enterococcus faecalis]EKE3395183.1 hypothetical protein [Enterococcus faecalis]MCU2273550.1 hypothetical protein [Enterococcus faecalis]